MGDSIVHNSRKKTTCPQDAYFSKSPPSLLLSILRGDFLFVVHFWEYFYKFCPTVAGYYTAQGPRKLRQGPHKMRPRPPTAPAPRRGSAGAFVTDYPSVHPFVVCPKCDKRRRCVQNLPSSFVLRQSIVNVLGEFHNVKRQTSSTESWRSIARKETSTGLQHRRAIFIPRLVCARVPYRCVTC